MTSTNSQIAVPGVELAVLMTGSFVEIGTLPENPAIIIFDNQGTDSVAISIDNGTTVWRTFPGGEALVLDLRAAHAQAPNFTFSQGTTFFGEGTAADGPFSISYIYAKNN